MKQFCTLVFLALLAVSNLNAQELVSRFPEAKNALLEEFTGTSCPFCVQGHAIVKTMRTQYPEDIWVVGYHPTTTGLTTPRSASDPDFRRTFPNAFYTPSFMMDPGGMPTGFINRKVYGLSDQTRVQSRGVWSQYARAVTRQNAQVNMGIAAYYDTLFHDVVVDVEAFFTQATNDQLIYVMLLEDSLIAGQSGSSDPNYEHNHVFREALTRGQWGDSMMVKPNAGNLYQGQFAFSNTQQAYDYKHLTVIAFLRDAVTEEISNVVGIEGIKLFEDINTSIESANLLDDVKIFPNPTENRATMTFTTAEASSVVANIFDAVGKQISKVDFGVRSAGTQRLSLDLTALPQGVYTVKIEAGAMRGTERLIKQ
ncbi:MAG: Omp28-related outer membrane protein [Bacteroidia bacterium]